MTFTYKLGCRRTSSVAWSDTVWDVDIKVSHPMPLAALIAYARDISRRRQSEMITIHLTKTNDPAYGECCPIRLVAWTDDPHGMTPHTEEIARRVDHVLAVSPDSHDEESVFITRGTLKLIRSLCDKAIKRFRSERFPSLPETEAESTIVLRSI